MSHFASSWEAVFQEIMWIDLQKLEHVGAKSKQSDNSIFLLQFQSEEIGRHQICK